MTIICFDTETYEKDKEGYLIPVLNTNKFTIGCLKYKGKAEFFQTPEQMRDRMIQIAEKNKKNRQNTYYYAHSARYDTFAVFREDIESQRLKLIREDPIIAVYENELFHVLDTMALINKRLKDIGKDLGIEKLEMPDKIKDLMEIKPYLERDVIITEELVNKIREIMEELGTKSKSIWTTPQLAMNHFINKAKERKDAYEILSITYKKNKNDKMAPTTEIIKSKHDDFLRKAYRLGRCEAFKTGTYDNTFYIDQNRQFPYALTVMDTPNLRQEFHLIEPLRIIKQESFLENYVGVVKATVDIDTKGIGILPVRCNDYEMVFPKRGRITGHWTITELKYALESGDYKLIDIKEAVFYKKSTKNPFKEHIEELYQKELEHPEWKIVTKLLMNGLIGKFGARIENEDIVFDYRSEWKKYKDKGYEVIGEMNNKFAYQKTSEGEIPKYANVMIALQCTATSRILMHENLIKIDKKDLIYLDTDGFIAKNWNKYKNKFTIGNKLGEFKIVKDTDGKEITSEKCKIIKEKCYKIGKTIKVSGLSKRLIQEDTLERIERGEIEQPKMIGLKEAITRGNMKLMGTFEDQKYTITEKHKFEVELPEIYEEK